MRLWLLSLMLSAAGLSAQTRELAVRLAPDQEQLGPTAWTWLRSDVLPRLTCWPAGLDPLDRFEIRVVLPADLQVHPTTAPLSDDQYFQATLTVDGEVVATVSAQRNGHERWWLPAAHTAQIPPRFVELAALLALGPDAGVTRLDIATVTGNLMAAAAEGDLESELLTFGALECGTVDVAAYESDEGVEVLGRSPGGLLLPAVLVFLADRQRHTATPDASLEARDASEIERWLVLAASAQLGDREEATRQLTRFDDERARRALEKLLFAEASLRTIAMASIARAGSTQSLERVIAAAERSDPAVAEASICTLWPDVAPPQRAQVLDLLAQHPQTALRRLGVGLAVAETEPGALRFGLFALLCVTLTGLSISLFVSRRS